MRSFDYPSAALSARCLSKIVKVGLTKDFGSYALTCIFNDLIAKIFGSEAYSPSGVKHCQTEKAMRD
jgi:hypothetical protein